MSEEQAIKLHGVTCLLGLCHPLVQRLLLARPLSPLHGQNQSTAFLHILSNSSQQQHRILQFSARHSRHLFPSPGCHVTKADNVMLSHTATENDVLCTRDESPTAALRPDARNQWHCTHCIRAQFEKEIGNKLACQSSVILPLTNCEKL